MKFQSGVLAKIPQKRLNLLLRIPIIRDFIKKKLQEALGLQHARICGSGAAPISPAVLEWFSTLGIEISEGFGMSETSGLVTSHHPFDKTKIGTVGRAAKGSHLRISDEGELLIGGDGIVKEYYKDPEKSAETFTDGWLRTGDMGEIDPDGFLRITGRLKELFKTGKGKYVAPVPIESLLLENPDIEQICVTGVGLPQPVAVVVLWEHVHNVAQNDQTKQQLAETLKNTNSRLESHERLSHIVVARDPWTIENDMLTPTMKIKRNLVEKKYEEVIARPKTGSVVIT